MYDEFYDKIFNGEIVEYYKPYNFLKEFFIEDIVYEIQKYINPIPDKTIYENFINEPNSALSELYRNQYKFISSVKKINIEIKTRRVELVKGMYDSICDLFFKISSKNKNETIHSLKQQINSLILKTETDKIYYITDFSIFKVKDCEKTFFYVGSPVFHLPISLISSPFYYGYFLEIEIDKVFNIEGLQFTTILYENELRRKLFRDCIFGFDKRLLSYSGVSYATKNLKSPFKCKEEIIHNIFKIKAI